MEIKRKRVEKNQKIGLKRERKIKKKIEKNKHIAKAVERVGTDRIGDRVGKPTQRENVSEIESIQIDEIKIEKTQKGIRIKKQEMEKSISKKPFNKTVEMLVGGSEPRKE